MSAERQSLFGSLERRALLLALCSTACLTLDFSPDETLTEHSAARLIEQFCKSGNYELVGSGKKTSGLTSDSCGFSVGPSPGAVNFLVDKSTLLKFSNYTFEALITGDEGKNPRWMTLEGDERDLTLVEFSVVPEGPGTRHIVDLRVNGQLVPDLTGCSVARQPRRSLAASAERTAQSIPEP